MFFLLFLLAIMCTFLGNYNGINQIGKILSFITLYIYISFLFKDSLINKFVLFLVCYLTIGISESLSIVFFQLFNPSFSLNNIYTSNTYLVIIILTQFFAYFFHFASVWGCFIYLDDFRGKMFRYFSGGRNRGLFFEEVHLRAAQHAVVFQNAQDLRKVALCVVCIYFDGVY